MPPVDSLRTLGSSITADNVSAVISDALAQFWKAVAGIPPDVFQWPAKITADAAAWVCSVADTAAPYIRTAGSLIIAQAKQTVATILAVCHAHPKLAGLGLLSICEPSILLTGVSAVTVIFFAGLQIGWLALALVGFGFRGIRGGSTAARYQSTVYGPIGGPPAGSTFSRMQRAGATSRGPPFFMPSVTLPHLGHPIPTIIMWLIRLSCGTAGVYVLWNF